MSETDTTNLVAYRLDDLDKRYAEIATLVRQTHDSVNQIITRLSGSGVLECQIHRERMTNFDKRMGELEEDSKNVNSEIEGLKRFIWKISGGLALAAILFSNVVSPYLLEMLKPAKQDPAKPHVSTQSTNQLINLPDPPYNRYGQKHSEFLAGSRDS